MATSNVKLTVKVTGKVKVSEIPPPAHRGGKGHKGEGQGNLQKLFNALADTKIGEAVTFQHNAPAPQVLSCRVLTAAKSQGYKKGEVSLSVRGSKAFLARVKGKPSVLEATSLTSASSTKAKSRKSTKPSSAGTDESSQKSSQSSSDAEVASA